MSILTFKGGIHPDDGKKRSKDMPIREIKPKGDLVFPLSQHIGAPAIPIVKVGDRVLKGQMIGKANGHISANIHSSVSGYVKSIEPRRVINGNNEMAMIIVNDKKEEVYVNESFHDLFHNFTRENVIEAIFRAGIVGMGGAGFPTHVKLNPKNPKEISHIIVNGVECEPYLTSDYRRMLEEPQSIIDGLKILLLLFPKAKGVIGVEDNKKDVIVKLTELSRDETNVHIKSLYTKYPQGAERQLIYAVTKKRLNASTLPADVGCIVVNVDTVYGIYQAIKYGKPLISRIVTVSGDAVKSPQNLLVPLGTSYEQLIEEAGGFISEPEKIISGGPMMGTALFDLDVPVVKGSSALICLKKDPVSSSSQTHCINCGRCVSVCPEGIVPARLAKASDYHDKELFLKLNGLECCECGACSYICPAKRDLTLSIKAMKKDIIVIRKKQQKGV